MTSCVQGGALPADYSPKRYFRYQYKSLNDNQFRQGIDWRSFLGSELIYATHHSFGSLSGLEPPTSPLSGVRSNHLSYKPIDTATLFHQTICVSTSQKHFNGKEVIQPQVPLRLPCYDFTPVMNHKVVALPKVKLPTFCNPLPWCDGRCVQGPGTYSPYSF